MPPPAILDLVPAEQADIPRLVEIDVSASATDNASIVAFLGQSKDRATQVAESLQKAFADETYSNIKAVDRETGIIAGWVTWSTPTDERIQEFDSEATDLATDAAAQGPDENTSPLAQHVKAFAQQWTRSMTGKGRHVNMRAVFTDPAFQRRGVGSAIVQCCCQAADEAGLPVIVQATPFGRPVYAKAGFVTVTQLDLDLRDWVPDGKANDRGYGNYTLYYMVR